MWICLDCREENLDSPRIYVYVIMTTGDHLASFSYCTVRMYDVSRSRFKCDDAFGVLGDKQQGFGWVID